MKERIINATINLFGKYGFNFKVDDIARELSMSKKTIYKYFPSKEDIFKEFITDSFESVHEEQHKILKDDLLSTKMKLIAILNTRSKYEGRISMETAIDIREYYPALSHLILQEYTAQWECVDRLLTQGKQEGVFDELYPNPLIMKLLLHAIQMTYEKDFLKENHITYRDSISKSVLIIIEGISTKKGKESI